MTVEASHFQNSGGSQFTHRYFLDGGNMKELLLIFHSISVILLVSESHVISSAIIDVRSQLKYNYISLHTNKQNEEILNKMIKTWQKNVSMRFFNICCLCFPDFWGAIIISCFFVCRRRFFKSFLGLVSFMTPDAILQSGHTLKSSCFVQGR